MIPNNKATMMNLFPIISIDGIKIVDFWRAWQIAEDFKKNINNFEYLLIEENDRWDTIAEQVYGDRQLWWTIAIFNDIEDPFSIYFEKGVPESITQIKYLEKGSVGILLNKIREKRLQFEKE